MLDIELMGLLEPRYGVTLAIVQLKKRCATKIVNKHVLNVMGYQVSRNIGYTERNLLGAK